MEASLYVEVTDRVNPHKSVEVERIVQLELQERINEFSSTVQRYLPNCDVTIEIDWRG